MNMQDEAYVESVAPSVAASVPLPTPMSSGDLARGEMIEEVHRGGGKSDNASQLAFLSRLEAMREQNHSLEAVSVRKSRTGSIDIVVNE